MLWDEYGQAALLPQVAQPAVCFAPSPLYLWPGCKCLLQGGIVLSRKSTLWRGSERAFILSIRVRTIISQTQSHGSSKAGAVQSEGLTMPVSLWIWRPGQIETFQRKLQRASRGTGGPFVFTSRALNAVFPHGELCGAAEDWARGNSCFY